MAKIVKLKDLKSALLKLEEGVHDVKNELDRDGVIQRFEFTFELVWKVLQEKDRNESTHIYNEKQAVKIFSHIPKFVEEVEKLLKNLSSK